MLYTRSICYYIQEAVRSFCVTESHMTSAERMMTWASLPAEPGADIKRREYKSAYLSSSATIEFKKVRMRYLPDQPLVMVHIESGDILLDGRSINGIALPELRQSIAFVPQDPNLFAGTLRSNLDRWNIYEDCQIWQALEKVGLNETFKEKKLDTIVIYSGANLSRGQRQLVGLARALLSPASIVVIDEATASIDILTEKRIQRVLNHEFANRTVMIIAHRLETLKQIDMLIEMSDGKVVSVKHLT